MDASPRTGRGAAHGAISVVNATATGTGCALAVALGTSVTWTPGGQGLRLTGAPDGRLVEAVAAVMGLPFDGAVAITCAVPPSRGLKSSSSVATALVRAAADARGTALPDADVERVAVEACRRAAVTLTGAYDDQVAVTRGGCHLTDNARLAIERSLAVPPWQVAVWVPDAAIGKDDVRMVDASAAAAGAKEAAERVRAGRIPEAVTRNGTAFHALYAGAGLPVDDLPARVALAKGALGAGLSGTGPAVAALFARRVGLPPVQGGTWRWTHAVPARPAQAPASAAAQAVAR